jgi:uroporphyrinogen-III synthase
MRRTAILVVRQEGRFSEVLRKNGCEVINLELIRTEPVNDLSEFIETVKKIGRYDGIFLTSPAAAKIFLHHLTLVGGTFYGRVYILGERSKAVLDGSGLNVISSPAANTAQGLIESFDEADFAGKNLLFIRGDRSVSTIPEMLGGIASVNEIVVYKSVQISPGDSVIENLKSRMKTNEIDWACFFSPSGIDGFMAHFGGEDLEKVKAAAIGETTARQANKAGLDVAFISERSNAKDFAAGFAAYIKKN